MNNIEKNHKSVTIDLQQINYIIFIWEGAK
mgnify:CR=1 FL=1